MQFCSEIGPSKVTHDFIITSPNWSRESFEYQSLYVEKDLRWQNNSFFYVFGFFIPLISFNICRSNTSFDHQPTSQHLVLLFFVWISLQKRVPGESSGLNGSHLGGWWGKYLKITIGLHQVWSLQNGQWFMTPVINNLTTKHFCNLSLTDTVTTSDPLNMVA